MDGSDVAQMAGELWMALAGGWQGLSNPSVDGPAGNADTLEEGWGTPLQGWLGWDSPTEWRGLEHGWRVVQLQRLHLLQCLPLLLC